MDWVRTQADRWRPGVLLGGYATIVGALSFVVDAGPAMAGDGPAVGRALLGLVGVVGGLLLWAARPAGLGWWVCLAWAVIQIPYVASNPEGSPTAQFIRLPLTMASQTTVNGVVTAYSEIGINLVGVVLAIVLARRRAALQRPAPAAAT